MKLKRSRSVQRCCQAQPAMGERARRRVLLAGLAVVAMLVGMPQRQALADEGAGDSNVQVLSMTQEDRDRDGNQDFVAMECAIETPTDRVLVYDDSRNMRRAATWQQATDFVDDTWIFDIGGNGGSDRASLIVDFSTDGDDTLARVYDGTTTGGVRYEIAGISVNVVEPQYPSLIIRTHKGWTNSDGSLNYNMIWQFDGPAANRIQAARLPNWFSLDGNPDSEGAVGDDNDDGVPEYMWTTLLAPVPDSEGFSRTGALVNTGRHRPGPLENVAFWPLLNRPTDPLGSNYFDTPMSLSVDWAKGLVRSFAFGGYPVEQGYHVNSLRPLERGRVNELNFENMMAYYDLANDHDGRPELFVRLVYAPPGDKWYVKGGASSDPMQMVQYSWSQSNADALLWDYKVDLAGMNPITSTVKLGEMVLQQVPYDELPRWVGERSWSFGTFVAHETGDAYLSSEGLYEWSTLEGVQGYIGLNAGSTLNGVADYTSSEVRDIAGSDQLQREYLAGRSVESPESLYQYILAGYRGEFGEMSGPATLYFSPIDGRLHLYRAKHGVTNLGSNRRVEYRNLDGDPFIDSWQIIANNLVETQLHQTADWLIYAADGEILLRKASVPRQLFAMRPPANTDQWKQLGAQLAAHETDLAPDDLRGMFGQFEGAEIEVTDAQMRDYRPVGEHGFRFVVELGPDADDGASDLLGAGGLQPGSYVVSYDGEFSVAPLTPPSLRATLKQSQLRALAIGELQVALNNDGLQDLPNATLELWATAPGGQAMLAVTDTVSLLAQTPYTATLEWSPPSAGNWTLTPQVRQGNGLPQALQASEVTVLPAQGAPGAVLVASSNAPRTLPLVALGLLVLATLAALTFWQQLRRPLPRGGDEHP